MVNRGGGSNLGDDAWDGDDIEQQQLGMSSSNSTGGGGTHDAVQLKTSTQDPLKKPSSRNGPASHTGKGSAVRVAHSGFLAETKLSDLQDDDRKDEGRSTQSQQGSIKNRFSYYIPDYPTEEQTAITGSIESTSPGDKPPPTTAKSRFAAALKNAAGTTFSSDDGGNNLNGLEEESDEETEEVPVVFDDEQQTQSTSTAPVSAKSRFSAALKVAADTSLIKSNTDGDSAQDKLASLIASGINSRKPKRNTLHSMQNAMLLASGKKNPVGTGSVHSTGDFTYEEHLELEEMEAYEAPQEIPVLLPVMSFMVLVLIPCYVLPAFLVPNVQILNPITSEVAFNLWVVGLSTLPFAAFMYFATVAWQFATFTLPVDDDDDDVDDSSFCGEEETAGKKKGRGCRPVPWTCFQQLLQLLAKRQTAILLFFAVMRNQFIDITEILISEEYQTSTTNLLNRIQAVTLYGAFYSLIGDVEDFGDRYAEILDSVPAGSKKSQKWLAIMKNFSRYKNIDIDKGYIVPGGSRSLASVMAELIAINCGILRLFGLLLLVLYLVGVDITGNLIIFGLSVAFAGLMRVLNVAEALQVIIPLALSNSFHVGEIISITPTGSVPGDAPTVRLTGFVESVTWGHLVIRDFKKKQVFVPMTGLLGMQIANWARRPNKLCFFQIPVSAPSSGGGDAVAKLTQFIRTWIKKNPLIDHTGYSKCSLKLDGANPEIKVIFYPAIGEKRDHVRASFIVMFLNACKRLDICITRTELRSSQCWTESADHDRPLDRIDDVLSDLMPSDDLIRRAGMEPPKKKKSD